MCQGYTRIRVLVTSDDQYYVLWFCTKTKTALKIILALNAVFSRKIICKTRNRLHCWSYLIFVRPVPEEKKARNIAECYWYLFFRVKSSKRFLNVYFYKVLIAVKLICFVTTLLFSFEYIFILCIA